MTDKQKQCLLTFLGYDTGGVDGIWGDRSRRATECVQEDLDIPADGVWGPQTENAVLEAVYTYDDGQTPETGVAWSFWDRIRYWSREEFRCRCGEYHAPYCDGFPVEPDETLVELVDDIRHHFGRPGHRSSGIRCYQHNIDSNGVANSKHRFGKALDFYIEGVSGEALCAYALRDPRCSYAYVITPGEPWVHVDVA